MGYFVYLDQLIAAGLLNYADCIGARHNGINVSPDHTWDTIPANPTARFRGPFDNPPPQLEFPQHHRHLCQQGSARRGRSKAVRDRFRVASADGLSAVADNVTFAYDNSLEDQRNYTIRALDFMSADDVVRLAILNNLNYGAQAGWAGDNDNVPYALIGPNFIFRPVFDAVRDWNRAYEARLAS